MNNSVPNYRGYMTTSIALTFYDFVAAIIPGSIFLVGCALFFDLGIMSQLLLPKDFGSLGIHIIAAYVAGQLIQAVSNWIEFLYWKIWKGMPTDWPITNPKKIFDPKIVDSVYSLSRRNPGDIEKDKLLTTWRFDLNSARSKVLMDDPRGRIQTFLSLYGMFKGLLTTFILLLLLHAIIYPTYSDKIVYLLIFSILSAFRMHRYAIYYAKELFYCITWKNSQMKFMGEKDG